MNGLITYNTLLPFGRVINDSLEISDSVSIAVEGSASLACPVITALSCYTGADAPHITFSLTAKGQAEPFYTSHIYNIGRKEEYTLQSWRVPPLFLQGMTMTVNIDVPQGTVLSVRQFATDHSIPSHEWNGGLRHNAHLGFWGLAPDNTMPAFELAAACGFPACIVVPKVTADGVLVCIHDDTINRTARDANGNKPEEPIYVKDLTYDELMAWDFGLYKNEIYKGTKIPLLEDFFALCSRTGMRPMFSTHPPLTLEQWQQVKEMLIRHGLLKKFHIKSFKFEVLETAYSVFGEEIDGYTWDNKIWDDSKIDMLHSIGIDSSKCRVGIEYPFRKYTEEIVQKILSAGFFSAAWSIERASKDEYAQLISWGVTEFTEDYHCSMGLNY